VDEGEDPAANERTAVRFSLVLGRIILEIMRSKLKMITVKNRNTDLVEEVVGNGSGAMATEPVPRYQDIGAVISDEEVAAGASVYSTWIDSVDWVRSIVTLTQGSQSYEVGYERRDSTLVGGGWPQVYLSAPPTLYDTWRSTSASVVFGYSVRFVIANKGTQAGIFSLRVQLAG
jgi:hypothetical protein